MEKVRLSELKPSGDEFLESNEVDDAGRHIALLSLAWIECVLVDESSRRKAFT